MTRCLLLCLLPALALLADEAVPAWPCWRGAAGTGAASGASGPFVDDLSQARLVWESEERRITSSYNLFMGGAGGPVVADGRVYLTYLWPSGEVDQAYLARCQELSGRSKATYEGFAKAYGMTYDEVIELKCRQDADDVVLCVDLATGKTVWKQVFAGKGGKNISMSGRGPTKSNKCGPHNIPAVAYGKVVAIGGVGNVSCLDAVTGKEIWQKPLVPMGPGSRNNGAISFAGGVFVLARGQDCIGVSPDDGTVRWEVPKVFGSRVTNPVRWLPAGGGEYIMAGATAIDPRSGTVLWTAPGAVVGDTTAVAVNGDYLVLGGSDDDDPAEGGNVGLHAYRITPQGATQAWALPADCASVNRCPPVIMDGHAYCKAADPTNRNVARWLRVDLTTGTMLASPSTRTDASASLIGGGGKLFYEGIVIDVATMTFNLSSAWAAGDSPPVYARSHTPCIVGHLFVVRGQTSLRCYDLRAR